MDTCKKKKTKKDKRMSLINPMNMMRPNSSGNTSKFVWANRSTQLCLEQAILVMTASPDHFTILIGLWFILSLYM